MNGPPLTPWEVKRAPPRPPTHLFFVLVDVEVQLTERAQCIELIAVETGLLHQIGVHVLIADAWHLRDIPVVPAGHKHTDGLNLLLGQSVHQKILDLEILVFLYFNHN